MTQAQARKAYQLLTEVQMMLGDMPKSKALKAYNKLNKAKILVKKSQAKHSKMKNRIKRCWGCDHLEFVVSDMSWLCPKTGREFSKRSEAERQTSCSHWEAKPADQEREGRRRELSLLLD